MNSSPKSTGPEAKPLLVAEGGVGYVPPPQPDPIAAWVELMEVVEALCPRWPVRERKLEAVRFRL